LIESGSDGRVDLGAVAGAVRHYAAAGVHGVYTADTASEFYAFEFDEWNDLATHFRTVARDHALPAGIGCTWTNQAGSLRRIARARELGYENIHLSQPYWIRLNEEAQRIFWRAVAETADGLPIIVYAGSQGQFLLNGSTLKRLCDHCPAIVGTKSLGFDAVSTNSMFAECPELAHFVHEQVLVFWMGLGAAGCFSNLAAFSPALALDWFAHIEGKRWQLAFEIQRRVNRFFEDGGVPIRQGGYTLDKSMAELGRVPGATRGQRPPYAAVPDALFDQMRTAARRHLPEFLPGTWRTES
jgi:dihydrodipicolinate synthase/N-acetylneuraminate lyase